MERLVTYSLASYGEPSDLSAFTHFFWTSGSRFLEAVARQPEILDRWHACGPGNSWKIIRESLGSDARLDVWLSHEQWSGAVIG
jgi:hydroxymethylbilane synthase